MKPTRKVLGNTWLFAAILIALLLSASSASADSFTTILNVNNSGLSGTDFGKVTLKLNGNAIDITATGDNGWGFIDGNVFGFNVVGGTTGLNLVKLSDPDFNDFTTTGSLTEDGFGKFTAQVDNKSAKVIVSQLEFKVTRTDGFTSVSQLEGLSSKGYMFGAHMYNSDLAQGIYAATSVPEPTSLLLLGTGLLGLVEISSKLRSKA